VKNCKGVLCKRKSKQPQHRHSHGGSVHPETASGAPAASTPHPVVQSILERAQPHEQGFGFEGRQAGCHLRLASSARLRSRQIPRDRPAVVKVDGCGELQSRPTRRADGWCVTASWWESRKENPRVIRQNMDGSKSLTCCCETSTEIYQKGRY
jgi:hypothetical protein